ncbi:MAG: transcriptional repressor [Planctomycetota bacterium]|nr:transcriptional repressor [Planctomycetota bacterium]
MPVTHQLITAVQERVRLEAKQRGIRWTSQRQVIVEQFLLAGEHVTADRLLERVREVDPAIGAATVYRTLHLLTEIGVAARVQLGNGAASYEPVIGRAHHDHLVCVACGTIIEFHDAAIEQRQEAIASAQGFRLLHHRLELFGLCARCQAANAASV